MPKRMLIDASHPEETRVVVLDGHKVEEFDFESATRRPLKGNIYLAKVTRVEPSLQAAFVEYGGNRQGFLAFSEIHPDYYQIPVADRIALLQAQTQRMMAEDEDDGFESIDTASAPRQEPMLGGEDGEEAAASSMDEQRHEEQQQEEEEEEEDESEGDGEGEIASGEMPHHQDGSSETQGAGAASDTESPAAGSSGESEASQAQTSSSVEEEGLAAPESGSSGEPAQPVSDLPGETPIVQAEATGVPQQQQRRGPRQNWPRPPRRRQYKIQEVIKRRQIILVQVVKEERGTKGASLTTFLSLAGRYCVLMPNTPRGGGISRKITNAADRKRLKSAAQSLELPEGMGLIIRTAGANRTKLEIKRDYEYLLRLWDTVRELTLKSNAPALVYEEGSLIKRAIRDLYNKDITEVQVDGDAGYRDAKDFMRMIMPSHAKNVKPYKEALPLFQSFQVEAQLDAMFSPTVTLRSGGYIVINQTEALVSIDVNSGKATREHSIEETAYKTNLEASDEIARQLRLRDLAGLIVIDYIDMEDSKNDRNVEKRLYNALKGDRARIQLGKISQFGLLEMSRQRLRSGVVAASTITCPHCAGLGIIRSTESAALRLLRALDEEGQRAPSGNITVKAPHDVTIYTLNHKRREVARIEEAYDLGVSFEPQASMMGGSFELDRTGTRPPGSRPKTGAVSVEAGFHGHEVEIPAVVSEPQEVMEESPAPQREHEPERARAPHASGQGQGEGGEGGKRRRRRRRRGGRGRDGQQPNHEGQPHHEGGRETPGADQHQPLQAHEAQAHADEREEADHGPEDIAAAEVTHTPEQGGQGHQGAPGPMSEAERQRKRRRRRGRRGRRRDGEMSMGGEGHQAAPANNAQSQPQIPDNFPSVAHAQEPVRDHVEPNAPSSPQWSLSDRQHEPRATRVEETPARHAPRAEVEHPPAVSEAKPEHAEERRAQPLPEAETPREPRKGWWQRKLGL
jgi:ribonuclease E